MRILSILNCTFTLSLLACSSSHPEREPPENVGAGGGTTTAGAGNLGGSNLGGSNLGGSNLGGSNLGGRGGTSTGGASASHFGGSSAEGGTSQASAGASGETGAAGSGGLGANSLELQVGALEAVTRLTQLSSTDANELYVVGWTNGAVGDVERIGSTDAFALKFDATGKRQWAYHLGQIGIAPGIVTKAWDAAVTPKGDLVIVGLVNGRGVFHDVPLSSTFTAFVEMLSSDGQERWLRLIGGTDGTTEAMGVEVLASGTIAVAGVTTASTLSEQVTLGGSDAFVAWYSPEGEPSKLLRYGGAGEEYPSAFGSRGDELFMAMVTAPRIVTDTQKAMLLYLDAAGTTKKAWGFAGETIPQIAALSSIENGVCATTAYGTYSPEAGAGTDYGFKCYSDGFVELSSVRRGAPGAHATPTSISCSSAGNCALAGHAATKFEGNPIASSREGFVAEFSAVSGAPRVSRISVTNADPDSYVLATALTRRRDGTLVVGGDVKAALYEPLHGIADSFVATVAR